jgi:putative transposase
MRKDVAFTSEQFAVSERRACKLMGMDRGSYRYEPRPDRNVQLREALIMLAKQKPRYGYRRLHALLVRRDHPASVMRIYRLYRAEGLAVRRLKRKRLSRVAVAPHLVRSNQCWILRATPWRLVEAFVF